MNSPRSALCSLLVATLFPVFAAHASEDVGVWNAGGAHPGDGGLVIPDKKGGFDFVTPSSAGISIGDKPSVGDDTKSIVFDGSQTAAFRTKSGFPGIYSTLRVSIAVKPESGSSDQDGTVLRYGTQWEIRYAPARSVFSLIVWNDDKTTYTIVSLPARPGDWQVLEGVVANGSMSFSVDAQKKDATLKGTISSEEKPVALVLGASRPNLDTSGALTRPFTGAVADIRIGVE